MGVGRRIYLPSIIGRDILGEDLEIKDINL